MFGVLGNHDHGDSKAPFVRPTDSAFIRECGVRLLTNEAVSVDAGGATVQVAGVDDSDGAHDDLPAVLAQLDRRPGTLRLLLSHHASVIRQSAPGDFHMTFAGDTHGGQICLPLPGRRVLLSDLGAEFAEGAYDVDGRPLYVTRGVGTSMLPFRAFCRPEVVVFRVEAGRWGAGSARRPAPCWSSASLAAVLAPLVLAACGGTPTGSPVSTGSRPLAGVSRSSRRRRRVQALLRPGPARLRCRRSMARSSSITDPMGGRTVVSPGSAEGTLELTSGGETTVLKPLPQHQ